MRRLAFGALRVVAGTYIGVMVVLYFAQRSMLFHPDPQVPDPAAYGLPSMSAERIETADGMRPLVWWAKPATPSRPVIVYFHGNAGSIGDRAGHAAAFMQAGYGVLLAGYRYNAGAGGEPSEEGLLDDGRAAVRFALSQGVEPGRIVLYGESLGTGIAVALATEFAVGGVILEMAYTSVGDIAQATYPMFPARYLVRDQFNSLARIGRVRAPILILHGESDPLIPASLARTLYEAAPEPKEAHFIPGGNHGNLWSLGAGSLALQFVDRVFPAESVASGQ